MSSGQNVAIREDIAQEACRCGYEGLVETFTDYETHNTSWDCPDCGQPHTHPLEGENN